MPHIDVPPEIPGIRGLMATRPETAKPMLELAQILLRGPSTLTPAERELIAVLVSSRNKCRFCATSHGYAAKHLLGGDMALVDAVCADYTTAPVSAKLRSLLGIAAKVQGDARTVSEADVAAAKRDGAIEREIHDTVLIAAAFSMFNRYVDGLAATTPDGSDVYEAIGKRLAEQGYQSPAKT